MASSAILSLLLVVIILVYIFYRSLVPTPIPGIPYTKSAIRPFGDAPEMMKYIADTEVITRYLTHKCRELQSPIIQVFAEPFKNPWVVVADSVTTEDILTRRTKEFDISPWFTGIFEATIPGSHLHLRTNDQWRTQRKTVNDLMSGHFLNDVAAARAHASCYEMIELWNEKIRLCKTRPFSVDTDLKQLLLDTIWSVAFGSSIGSTRVQNSFLTSLRELPQDSVVDPNSVAIVPMAPTPAAYNTLVTIADSHLIPIRSPFGPLHHKLAFRFSSKLRKAKREKEALITERLNGALENATSDQPTAVACAADLLIRRERTLADKEGRCPLYDTPVLRDELYTFLQAGSDTTATTMQWGLKYLTANQKVQSALRTALHEAHGSVDFPTSLQIATTHIPYLDATVEEVFRCATTAGIVSRAALVECEVLGCVVPAGTNVLMTTCGPTYLSPGINRYPELSVGSESQQDMERQNPFRGNWDPKSLSEFQPERWLYTDENGQTRFTVRAGPAHAMGTGPRHCFGKPMATLFLRVFLTLILYAFDLDDLPPGLEEFKAVQKLTHQPKNVYLRLRRRLEPVPRE